jgi:hypothetical protein
VTHDCGMGWRCSASVPIKLRLLTDSRAIMVLDWGFFGPKLMLRRSLGLRLG